MQKVVINSEDSVHDIFIGALPQIEALPQITVEPESTGGKRCGRRRLQQLASPGHERCPQLSPSRRFRQERGYLERMEVVSGLAYSLHPHTSIVSTQLIP